MRPRVPPARVGQERVARHDGPAARHRSRIRATRGQRVRSRSAVPHEGKRRRGRSARHALHPGHRALHRDALGMRSRGA